MYQKINFQDGEILYADQLNKMDTQLAVGDERSNKNGKYINGIMEIGTRENLFDQRYLANAHWQRVGENEWKGLGLDLGSRYGTFERSVPYPILFNELSAKYYEVTYDIMLDAASTGNGSLNLIFEYEDGFTYTIYNMNLQKGQWAHVGKRLENIPHGRIMNLRMTAPTDSSTSIWHLKNVQITEGIGAKPYTDEGIFATAVDVIARGEIAKLKAAIRALGGEVEA